LTSKHGAADRQYTTTVATDSRTTTTLPLPLAGSLLRATSYNNRCQQLLLLLLLLNLDHLSLHPNNFKDN